MTVTLEKVTTILFDVGGVLIRLHGTPFKLEWLGPDSTHEHIWKFWHQSAAVLDFECGQISAEEFAQRFIKEAGLHVSIDDFLAHFLYWPKDLFDGVHEALQELGSRYRLAALSNSNAYHWPRVVNEMRLGEVIADCISSHQLGVMKPSPEAFEMVIEKLGIPADEILFLDDLQRSVDCARELGMQAVKVTGTEGVMPTLAALGLLPEATKRQAV